MRTNDEEARQDAKAMVARMKKDEVEHEEEHEEYKEEDETENEEDEEQEHEEDEEQDDQSSEEEEEQDERVRVAPNVEAGGSYPRVTADLARVRRRWSRRTETRRKTS